MNNHEPVNSHSANEDYLKANQYFIDAKNDSALIYINLALSEADTSNYVEMTDIYLLSSKVYNNLSEYEKAMEKALKGLEISEHQHLLRKKAASLLCIGNIHYRMYNDDIAEQYALQAKAIAEENNYETETMQAYLLLGQIAKVVVENKQYKRLHEAFVLFNQSLEIAKKQCDTVTMITTLLHLGDSYISLNRFVDRIKL